MQILDWIIIALTLGVILAAGLITQKYLKSVADFLSGGRLAGPYLLAVSRGELQAGAVVFVALFEVVSHSGFTLCWWQWLTIPIGIVVALTGFVIYRYRETRAMTLAQFFELRYSKNFRVFTGLLGFGAGVVNFGIIPAIGARCMVYYMGLPAIFSVFSLQVQTYIPLMALFLGIALFLTLSGGLITLMITDCLEGIISQLFYLAIIVALLTTFSWTEISETLGNRPAGQSLLDPFDSLGLSDFNLWYAMMTMFVAIYGTMAWQNSSAYNSAAITPHASKMGGIMGKWREVGKGAIVTLLAVCAVTYLNHPDFATQAASVHQAVAAISDHQVQQQMEVPIALSHLLPAGIKGLFCAILLMGIFGGDSTHLHSWGGIFVQDVLVPLRKKPFAAGQHIRALRLSILGVALFAFLFGIFFTQTEYIVMWWQITTAIYVGGAGAAIIGGLYWKKGTTAAAWVALLAGSGLSVAGIIIRQIWGEQFPLNGVEISFIATLLAIALYGAVSLLTCRTDFDMDRLLHRGEYAAIKEQVGETPDTPSPTSQGPFGWKTFLGFDEHFTLGDKWISGSLFGWSLFWLIFFVIGTIWNLIQPWPLAVWSTFWRIVGIWLPIGIAFVTGIWFAWGGARDIRRLFISLRAQHVNHLDDGTVVGHLNRDEAELTSPAVENRPH